MNTNDVPGGRAAGSIASSSDACQDAVFEALADGRRRIAVRMLARGTEPVAVADVARQIATLERDGGNVDDHEDRVYVELVHVHVPKLVDAGLLEHDCQRNAIEGTDALETVHRGMAAFERHLDGGC